MTTGQRTTGPLVGIGASRGAYGNVQTALGFLDLSFVAGKTVLIKPNAGRMVPPCSGINTSPDAVAACVDALRTAGAAQVAVGESPIQGVRALDALQRCGIADAVKGKDVELIDLDRDTPRLLRLRAGAVLPRVRIGGRVRQFDVLVSLAVMKTHMHTGVSLSIKNMKGILYKRQKVEFHQLADVERADHARPLDIAISDLLAAFQPHIGIIDGWIGLEGLGPSAGNPRKADVAVASRDPVAADAVACRLMGIDPLSIAHLRLSAEKGVGTADLTRIRTQPADYEKHACPFARPPSEISLAFPDVMIYDAGACSACLSTALLFLQRYRADIREYRLKDGKLHIVLGKDTASVPAGTIVIGNCAAKHKRQGPFAKGCPPVASAIYAAVTGKEPDNVPSL